MLMKRLMMTYTPMNYNVVDMIRQDPAYKKMSSYDVLERIMNHEMNIQEANNIKNLYKGVSTSKKQDIALKTNKSKKKKVLIETLRRKKKKKKKKRRRKKKIMKENMIMIKWFYSSRNSTSLLREECLTREKVKKSQGQRGYAIIMVRMDILLPNAHMRGRKKTMIRERSLTKTSRKTINILRRSLMVNLILTKNGTQVMRVLNQKAMTWQP
jgi:hypothetical protein